jgi:hypothetical protein
VRLAAIVKVGAGRRLGMLDVSENFSASARSASMTSVPPAVSRVHVTLTLGARGHERGLSHLLIRFPKPLESGSRRRYPPARFPRGGPQQPGFTFAPDWVTAAFTNLIRPHPHPRQDPPRRCPARGRDVVR